MGLDEISAKLLKCVASVISDSLCNLFNCSIAPGVFPDNWKIAKLLKPLHKGDAKDLLNNYRPISVLSAVSKIFERIIYDQLQAYLNENGLIYDKQSGFRPVHSTTSALLDATTEWLSNMDKGQLNSVVFIDLAKEFDTVDHEILLSKLQIYGVDSMSLNWFRSYLFDRKKSNVNGLGSIERSLLCGVPQGSILGPLLFLVYINDHPSCLQHSTARMYADDTNIATTGKSTKEIASGANADLENIHIWLKANKLTLNVTKTEYMFIASDSNLDKLRDIRYLVLGGKPIKRVKVSKSLGIFNDERLSWRNHIDKISKTICSGISGLRQVREFVTLSTLLTIYHSLIPPIFDYCDVVLDNMSITLAQRLQSPKTAKSCS